MDEDIPEGYAAQPIEAGVPQLAPRAYLSSPDAETTIRLDDVEAQLFSSEGIRYKATGLDVPEEVGTVTDRQDGTFAFTPRTPDDRGGRIPVEVSVQDGEVVTQKQINLAPVVSGAVELEMNEDGTLIISSEQLLESAHDAQGDALSAFNLEAEGGTLIDNGDGTWAFIPDEHFYGEIKIRYMVSDGVHQIPAQGVVHIAEVNDAPVIGDVPEAAVLEGDGLMAGQLESEDVDDHEIAVFSVSEGHAAPAGFVLDADGHYSFDATVDAYAHLNVGDSVVLTVPVTVTDRAGATDFTQVRITVNGTNDAPVAGAEVLASVDEAAGAITGQITATDVDDDAVLTFTVGEGTVAPAGFTLNPDGSFVFNPADTAYDYLNAGDSVTLTVPVTVTDEHGATDISRIRITVGGTNDAPVAGAEVLASVDEGAAAISGQLLATDADDDAVLTFTVGEGTAVPAGFTLNPDGSFVFNPADIAYEHLGAGDSVTLTVPVTVTDEHGATDASEIRITVDGTNDVPVVSESVSFAVREDVGLLITEEELLAYAADIDGDVLSVRNLTSENGAIADNGDGTWTFTPDEHFSGEAVLAYDVTDGIDSTRVGATVVVEGVADGAAITLEGVAGESLASFGDDNIVGSGGSAQLNGWETDNVGGFIESYDDGVYGVEDGRGKVVELERNRGDASNIYRNVDVEAGDTVRLTFDLSARAGRGGEDSAVDVMWEGQVIDTIVPEVGWESYSYTFTATTDQPRLELKATDNNSTGAVLDVIQVSEVVTDVLEDNAVAVRLDAALIDADGSETLTALSVDDLAVGSIVSDGVNEVAISEAGQAVDVMGWDLNNLTITPEPNFNGELVVHVSATTEEANGDTRTTTASTSFDILPVNDATEVSGPTRFATDEDTGFVLTEDLLLATATDVDGDVLGIRNLSAENGTVIDNGDGTWTFVPAQDFNGEARLFYDIFDGTGLVPAHGLIDVAAVNDVPVAEDAVVDADEGGVPVTGQVAAVDVDDGAVLTFTLGEGTTAPAGFTLNPDGSFVFNPADIAYDHLGAGDSMTLTVPVT
ncbi:MAG: tandem-95 repeat protein, partial [Desulfovibrionaceae bacterium]|nr:tandem-95 repeat protein [Desulfovibrionaceae bacterium]